MDVNLKVGDPAQAGTLILEDVVTGLPVSATFSNLTAVVADPSIATVTVDANGVPQAVGLVAGTTTVTISATADYTDSNGNPVTGASVSADPITLIVTQVQTPDGVRLVVTFA